MGAELQQAPTATAQDATGRGQARFQPAGRPLHVAAEDADPERRGGCRPSTSPWTATSPPWRVRQYTGPITLASSANVSAIAVVKGVVSPVAIEGYLIKTAEKPLASFAVMSDVHTSTYDDNAVRWQKHFDTLQRILPQPDAIISNGDQINDNNFNTGDAHAVVRSIFEENLERKGMDDTKVLMTFGNHDDRLAKMSAMYPRGMVPTQRRRLLPAGNQRLPAAGAQHGKLQHRPEHLGQGTPHGHHRRPRHAQQARLCGRAQAHRRHCHGRHAGQQPGHQHRSLSVPAGHLLLGALALQHQ